MIQCMWMNSCGKELDRWIKLEWNAWGNISYEIDYIYLFIFFKTGDANGLDVVIVVQWTMLMRSNVSTHQSLSLSKIETRVVAQRGGDKCKTIFMNFYSVVNSANENYWETTVKQYIQSNRSPKAYVWGNTMRQPTSPMINKFYFNKLRCSALFHFENYCDAILH